MEDYLQLLLQMTDHAPDILFESSAFPVAFKIALATLSLIHSDVIFAALNFLRIVLTHDCLIPHALSTPPKFPIYANAIRQVIEKEGFELVGLLLSGLVGDFPEETSSSTISIFRVLATLWSAELLAWCPVVLQRLPATSVPDQAKTQFMKDLSEYVVFVLCFRFSFTHSHIYSAITAGEYEKVKYAILGVHRASRKTRDRRRVSALNH